MEQEEEDKSYIPTAVSGDAGMIFDTHKLNHLLSCYYLLSMGWKFQFFVFKRVLLKCDLQRQDLSYLVSSWPFSSQVPKLKKPALMLSLVPDDVGKPTVKLGKAAVQDGTCIWENPVYESVKLIEESKTGKLKEKIYHFIVSSVWKNILFWEFFFFPLCLFVSGLLLVCSNSNGLLQGSSKAGYLGEASIDFADIVAETEPLTVILPLKFANSGVVLHVRPLSLSLTLKHTHALEKFSWFNTTSSVCSQNKTKLQCHWLQKKKT